MLHSAIYSDSGIVTVANLGFVIIHERIGGETCSVVAMVGLNKPRDFIRDDFYPRRYVHLARTGDSAVYEH